MRTSRFLVLLLLVGAVLPQQVIAEPAPGYRFPDHPVMMHLSVASNGSFALIGITLSEYGKIPDYMCPIDSPDTYLSCRELSARGYQTRSLLSRPVGWTFRFRPFPQQRQLSHSHGGTLPTSLLLPQWPSRSPSKGLPRSQHLHSRRFRLDLYLRSASSEASKRNIHPHCRKLLRSRSGDPSDEGRVYISIVHIVPHYSPENFTFVDLCVNRREILHAEIGSSGTFMLNMPFPGLFSNLNGSWVYNRLSNEAFRNFCLYHWGPAFNETFLFDPAELTLHPLEGSPHNSTHRTVNRDENGVLTTSTAVSRLPSENVSQCIPSKEAASMVKGVKVGSGVLFYYPFYVTGISLKGHGWAIVWGDYSSNTPTALNDTCLAFYYSDDRITSALKAKTAVVRAPVGKWNVDLEVPYIDTGSALNASLELPTKTLPGEEGSGVCGPAAIIGFLLVPLLLRRKRRE